MEIGLAILLFVCMTALLYVLLSLKISRQVDLQIKEFYKTRIHADMQEFYREMEGYAALFENRIQRFRVLVERNEAATKSYDAASERELLESLKATDPAILESKSKSTSSSTQKQKGGLKNNSKAIPVVDQNRKRTSTASSSKKIVLPSGAKTQVNRKNITLQQRPIQHAVNPTPATPIKIIAESNTQVVTDAVIEIDNDVAIAEELMKDIFLQDQVNLSRTTTAASVTPKSVEQGGLKNAETESAVSKLLANLGKSASRVLFGGETAAQKPPEAPVQKIQTVPPATPPKGVADFAEVLRRAEQIKAEKKAERERAEVEARAEFYRTGDAVSIGAATVTRNTLAVKELDKQMVNFLIDSLTTDVNFRKQALRTLTENNIPLDEIARRSKIDIGELELMRQLGRF
ncbi:MAG: hypothetical protein JSR44_04135 [Spirochaetes bacterium]|nr:hypothetical protein [Spirochaetota bacterium]